MGLLDGVTHQQYYQGNDHGNYQFSSLENIINQFMVVYVGEEKTIREVSRADVAFYAQRAMQELSFDTFKSIKSQEIVLPSTNIMILPHDYVNYTRVLWSDSSGIKHPVYPTRDTQNPLLMAQDENGNYTFSAGGCIADPVTANEMLRNPNMDWPGNYSGSLIGWHSPSYWTSSTQGVMGANVFNGSELIFQHQAVGNEPNVVYTINYAVQEVDITCMSHATLTVNAEAVNSRTGIAGNLRVGVTTQPWIIGMIGTTSLSTTQQTYQSSGNFNDPFTIYNPYSPRPPRALTRLDFWDVQVENGAPSYLEWTTEGDNTPVKQLVNMDFVNFPSPGGGWAFQNVVYVLAVSWHEFTGQELGLQSTNNISSISLTEAGENTCCTPSVDESIGISTTWTNYSSSSSSGNQDSYTNNLGGRYGLDPQHAQNNGSFYVDNLRGTIHFSPSMAGKTVVLDYISDSLGTDKEMQVHKFAEEAVYKWIQHAIISNDIGSQKLVTKFKKEKATAIRKAKLRLSNIKTEELTQVFRGKSKQIKH